ncbi:Efflux pump roqT [Colletotrichum gloeosporioides]|uniref:Efflux pump roqT n=1 Tax=Colletotrichum gloeosporioides TaxID=474922 RepID=A0A8H4FE47_COLGL|nr:Efflux pump roqT [Colletotrichum gloeosporioides]KAF3798993.1 Efflux pump roqT [Colletotrichum gloeosporioides]
MFDPKDPSMSPIMESQSFPNSRASTLTPSNESISDTEKESGTSSAAASIQDFKIWRIPLPKTTAADSSLDSTSLNRGAKSSDEVIPDYPTGMKLGLIVLALCLSVFVMALDNSIIATAIPRITDEFNSLNDVGWYGSAYLLTTASFMLLFGKLFTFFSIKWFYLLAIAFFELGSLICGTAPSSIALVVGRAIAGIGGAGIYVGSLIILTYSVPLEKRPIYTSFVSSMWGISNVAGPLLGGLFTDSLSWRWCFLVNLPIGAVTVLVILVFFPDSVRKVAKEGWRTRLVQMDPIGNLLFMPAIICLLLALHWGGVTYSWKSSRIIALLFVFGAAMASFIYIQYRNQDNATVPPRIFRKRSVWSSAFYAFNLGAAFLLSVYFLPIWFQSVKGASAVNSGVMNLPMLGGVVIFSLVAGALVTLWGYYTPWMILGSMLMAIGYGLISTFKPDTPAGLWIGFQIIAGTGVGFGMQQPLMAVQVVLDAADVPTGTAIIIFSQTIGGAIFVAIGQMAFTNKLVDSVREYVPGIDPATVIASGVTAVRENLTPELLRGISYAYSDALAQAFLVSAVTASVTILGALIVEWKSVKGRDVRASIA